MSEIAFIPADNRPVCFQLPRLVTAQAKEHNLYLPDIEFMGSLTKASNTDEIFNWLKELKNIDIYIISLDTIAYGGLISSRRTNDGIEKIINRINEFFEIIQNTKSKNAKVFAFSSIMRISDNNINEEEKSYWAYWGKKIFEYSYNFHKKGIFKTDIPKEILHDYLDTRKRNFEVNKYYMELKKQGLIDFLVFSKDDCAKFGLNVLEAKELEMLSRGLNNVFIKTGADEIPLVLLSNALNKEKKIKIYPFYLYPFSIDRISRYEDITVKQAVENQIELSGGIVSTEENFDMMLIVNNFKREQGELVMDIKVPLFDGSLNIGDKPYFIADILNANGGDNNFVSKLLSKNLENFYGYAAWNTTSNTLGSVISGALTYYKAEKPDKSAFNELQTVRFLDDWAYQANVRNKIRDNILNLSPEILKNKMKEYEKIIISKFPIKKEILYYFPWNRFFEIGVLLK